MTLEEVQKEIDRLNAIKRELEVKDLEHYESRARQFVGKCYRNHEGQVIKIIGIPQRVYGGDFQWHYKKHYFQALYLQYASLPDEHDYYDDFAPCYCDEIYFDVTQFERPYDYIEITKEEFNEEFDKCIAHFKEQIDV